MNMTRKIAYLFSAILLGNVLIEHGHNPATATTAHAAQSVPASTTIVAQAASSTRDRGAIHFSSDSTTASVTNFVEGSGIDRYAFDASAGQPARISIDSANGQVLLTLIAPDGTPIVRSQSGGASWSGTLPMNGTYRLDAVNQYVGSQYTVKVDIQPAGGNGTQIHDRGSIKFPAGGTDASIDGYLAAQNIDRYHFSAAAGQPTNLTIRSPQGQVLLTLIDPNGNPIVRYQSGASSWSGTLPADGIYQVDVTSQSSASSYSLRLSIRQP